MALTRATPPFLLLQRQRINENGKDGVRFHQTLYVAAHLLAS